MKITVEIADPLLREARKLAAREGVTLRALVERGLRRVIAETKQGAPFKLRRASFKGKGLRTDTRGPEDFGRWLAGRDGDLPPDFELKR